MSSKGGDTSQRALTQEEKDLYAQQKVYLDQMGKIAEEQFGLSKEDRTYYEDVFRTGTDTEARNAVADLRSKITGTKVDPNSIKETNLDSLLRDLTLTTSSELRDVTNKFAETTQKAYDLYGAKATGLSEKFSQQIGTYTKQYADEIAKTQAEAGTIKQDILSRETGAAQAGISSSYAEARRQIQADLARRGISGSGVEAGVTASMYQQQAQAQAAAGYQARQTSLQQSEALRQQQLALSGQLYQTNVAGAQTQFQTESANLANLYGISSQLAAQNYNLGMAAGQQQISNLSALSAMGAGIYSGSQNYLTQAGATYSSGANIAGSTAGTIGQQDVAYQNAQMQAQATETAGLYGAIGTATGMAAAKLIPSSDIRFKNNIELVENVNGVNIYTWEWNDFAKEYGANTYEPKGVIAQEIVLQYPEFVAIDENGYYMVDYDGLYKKIGK